MDLDLEMVAILLQRRYNILREIKRLTDDMQEAISRRDEVSLSLVLQMRAEEIAKYDALQPELWRQAEKGIQEEFALKRLLRGDIEKNRNVQDPMERKIYEIRIKTKELIQQIQQQDRILNQQVTGRR